MVAETQTLAAAIVDGNRRALARAITLVENNTPEAGPLLAALYPHTGQAHLVGVTGAPGTGKSTLVNQIALHLRQRGKTVGVIAVDPTSPFSGGAILGDRIRMRDLAGDPGIFIRSMATRGSLGGLARAASDVVTVLDAAGFDVIIIETVGAGQSEVDVASLAHTVVVVEAPGLGDDVQAIKAGILEIADVLVVNKADDPRARDTVRALRAMLNLSNGSIGAARRLNIFTPLVKALPAPFPEEPVADGWKVPIEQTVALSGEGLPALIAQLDAHLDYLTTSGELERRRWARALAELDASLRDVLLADLLEHLMPDRLASLIDRIMAREIMPRQAASLLAEEAAGGRQASRSNA